jgi:lysophospholipase L1-like esterase
MITAHLNHPWTRYVALGDSFIEGIGEPELESVGGNRGWVARI